MKEKKEKIMAECPGCKKTHLYPIVYDELKNGQKVLFNCPYCKESFSGELKIENEIVSYIGLTNSF